MINASLINWCLGDPPPQSHPVKGNSWPFLKGQGVGGREGHPGSEGLMDQARVVKPAVHVNKTHVCACAWCVFFQLSSKSHHRVYVALCAYVRAWMCVWVCMLTYVYVSAAAVTPGSIKCSHSGQKGKKKKITIRTKVDVCLSCRDSTNGFEFEMSCRGGKG